MIRHDGLIYALMLAIEVVSACFDQINIETHKYQHGDIFNT